MITADLAKEQKANLERNYLEYEKCRLSPHYFFSKYVYIQDSNNNQKIKWQAWSHLVELLDGLQSEREIVVGKANQLGVSWAVCGYGGVWLPLFHNDVNTLMISQKEQGGSWELIKKCLYILKWLPPYLTRKLKSESKSELEFADNDSRVLALPSTQKAGAGFNASFVFRDELDLHPYAAQNFAFISPTIDSGSAQLIDVSTRNPDIARESSHFMQRYIQAKAGQITAKAMFFGWRCRPNRAKGISQDEWFEKRIRQRYPNWEVDAHYPETEVEFLAEARRTRYFSADGIDWIRRDCFPPMETDPDYPTVKIWSHPEVGMRYCSFLDPSNGGDPHAAGWMEMVSKRIVCVSHGRVSAEKCAEIFDKYNRYYNNAFNEFELNGESGRTVAQVLDVLGTPNRRMAKGKHGWYTAGSTNSKSNVRDLMIDGLEEVVRNKRMRIHYSEIPNELDNMIRKEGAKPYVPSGKHDDLIMMLGGLWQISKERQFSEVVSMSGACEGFA